MKKYGKALLIISLLIAIAIIIPAIAYFLGWIDGRDWIVAFVSSVLSVIIVDWYIYWNSKNKMD